MKAALSDRNRSAGQLHYVRGFHCRLFFFVWKDVGTISPNIVFCRIMLQKSFYSKGRVAK